METSEKMMREFLKTAQMWQRKAMLKRKADVEVKVDLFNGKSSVHVSAFLRDEKSGLAKDENGELISKHAILYYFDDEQVSRVCFEAVGEFLTNHNAI